MEETALNFELLDKAKDRVSNVPILINMISKRVRQLNSGFRPYIPRLRRDEDNSDLAMREIAEGKLIAEMVFTEPEPEQPLS